MNKIVDKIKKVLLFGFLFILFLYKDLCFLIPLALLKIDYDKLSYKTQLLLSLASSIVLILILVLIYHKYLKEKLIDYKKNFKNYFDLGMKYWFLGLIGMCFFNVTIAIFSPIKEANNEVLVQQMLNQAPLLSFISATFLAPFQEEMLFRKCLGDIFKNKTLKIIMCGLIFGLLHVVFSLKTPWDLLYVIPYGLLGASFAIMITKKDNIFIPITFHMLHNGLLTLLSILPMVLK